MSQHEQAQTSPADAAEERHFSGTFVRSTLHMMLALRQRFDSDIELAVILLVLLDQALRQPGCNLETIIEWAEADYPTKLPGINAMSMADTTGIPRETVRRKLRTLQDCGWAQRGDDGLYRITPLAVTTGKQVFADLLPLLLVLSAELAGNPAD